MASFSKQYYTINDPDKLIEFINGELKPKKKEKNENGEVFTPLSLVNEMLDKLDEAYIKEHGKSIFTEDGFKWLEPTVGIGNFPIIVYQRLMKGLKIQNEEERKKHILEQMIYSAELTPKNVFIYKNIFCGDKYKLNIYQGDTLKMDMKKEFKLPDDFVGFDVIIGNPPFQIEQQGKRKGGYGGRTLWDKFVIKSLDLLVENGYLCFITPSSWRKPENKLYKLMTKQNQLVNLHIISKKKSKQLFDVSQRVDLYIIQKQEPTKNTAIIDELDNSIELDVTKWAFLPNYEFDNIKKIMTTEEDGIKIIYDRTIYGTDKTNMRSKQTEKYKYPIVHCINKDGLVFWYTDDKTKGHFGIPKVLLNFNEQQYPVNDYDGKYGMSQLTFGIPITSKKQGDDIVKAINSDEFKEIIKATKWGAFQTYWRMFKYFKPDFTSIF